MFQTFKKRLMQQSGAMVLNGSSRNDSDAANEKVRLSPRMVVSTAMAFSASPFGFSAKSYRSSMQP